MVRRAVLTLVAALLALGAAAGQTSPTTAAPKDVPFTVTRDVRYGTADGQDLLLDAYVPDDTNAERVAVVLIHGGAWRTGDKRDVVEEANLLARRGWVVFAVNYRLRQPEAFPAEIDDVETAVRWARENAYEYRMDPGRVGALGISAGGHLAAMLATLGEGPPDRGGRILVGASWSGPMDLTTLAGGEAAGLSTLLLPCPPTECPQRWADASPINQVDPTDAPFFLANSTDELVPVDQARSMAARLDKAGIVNQLVVVPGGRHGHDLRDEVWPATVAFLDEHLTRPTNLRDPNPQAAWVLLVVILIVTTGGVIGGLRVRKRLNAQTPRARVTDAPVPGARVTDAPVPGAPVPEARVDGPAPG
jgi:acetyl esterase/lipase